MTAGRWYGSWLTSAVITAACAGSPDPPSTDDRATALAAAESMYIRGAYDSARALWRAEQARAAAAGDSATIARVLTWFSLVARKQGDYVEARQVGESALALKHRLGLSQELFKSYNALGLIAWNEGRLDDATRLYTLAGEAARQAGDRRGMASVPGNLALVQTDRGDFAAARQGYVTARELGRALGDARIEANAFNNLGALDIQIGDPQSAIASLLRARALYRSIGSADEHNALGQLADAYGALGDYRRAIAAGDSALALTRRLGLRQEEASNLEVLARRYREAGDVRQALALYAEARRIDTELGLDNERGSDLRAEAEIHASLGDPDRARRYVEEALSVHQRVGDPKEELADRLVLAEVYDRAGRAAEAGTQFTAARRLAVGLGVRTARVDVALAEARAADRAGAVGRVLAALDRVAVDLAAGGYDSEWQAASLRARALARRGALEEAAAAGRRAVAAIERVRGSFGSGQLRTAYLADRAAAYTDLVGVLVSLNRIAEAFEVSDAARGRALLDRLAGSVGPGPAAADSGLRSVRARASALAHIDALVVEIAAREQALDEATAEQADALARLRDRLRRARTDYEALLVRFREVEGIALLGGDRTTAPTVRSALVPGEVLVEYLVTPDRVIAFVVTPEEIRAVFSPIRIEQLQSRIRLTRDLVGRVPGGTETEPVLAALYEVLIAPIERAGALRGVSTVIVIPHGPLAYVPFAALRGSGGEFLAERFAIVSLPAAGVLPGLRNRQATAAAGRVALFAPQADALPATRDETRAIAAVLPAARMVAGRRATEARVRDALNSARVVHIASHGVLNLANPLFSRIELARGPGRRAADDGRLEAHELLDARAGAELVFLSGCETGAGVVGSSGFAQGEDYATLAQAFLHAGTQHVIATLWRVEDEGAAVLAAAFYRHLAAGAAPAAALAAAQRDLLSQSRYESPFYWAGYVISGVETREAANEAHLSVGP